MAPSHWEVTLVGPVVIVAVAVALGAASGGIAGAVGGLAIGIGLLGAVAAGAATWARQIGSEMDPEEARMIAPRPPGLRAMCDYVYERTLPALNGEPPAG